MIRSMQRCRRKYISQVIKLLTLSLLVLSCSGDAKLPSSGSSDDFADNEIYDAQITLYRTGKILVQSKSDYLLKNEGEDALLTGNVISDFFNDEGEHISKLYSDSAYIKKETNNLLALGNVVVVSDSGYTLFTDRLHYDNQYKLITSNDSITFTTTFNDTMYGIGFESDVDLTHSKIIKPHGFYQDRGKDE